MPSGTVEKMLRQADSLSEVELRALVEALRHLISSKEANERPQWRDARGTAMKRDGMDAQDWVSRERTEAQRVEGTGS